MKYRVLAALLLAAPLSALAGEKLYVQVPAMLDPAAPIAQSVRAECGVEQLVGVHSFGAIAKRFPDAQQIGDPKAAGSGKLVRVTITSVMGVGGGAWSGPKSMSMRADLVQDGKTLASKVVSRNSSGGFWGGSMGTCAIIERIAVALGRDVAAWVPGDAPAAPPPAADAQQGDIKP